MRSSVTSGFEENLFVIYFELSSFSLASYWRAKGNEILESSC